ncbi:exonuclease domain-containing protein [Priestia megaterium]|uniref:exonuclease domain-containing protein n=1 Tax=Priestia megaterium TaxID=1404 RepID=UPI00207AB74C|nr:exonuclease domain-containing protein [Priestia megaterium]USL27990.1 3'-5' exoribonuclease [Priestia megaterium]
MYSLLRRGKKVLLFKGMTAEMKSFVAFDFETANRNRHSICSVGMVFVEDGKVIDTIYELINPQEEFDFYNISIHGIEPKDVEGAPTFTEFYELNRDKFSDRLFVAHYLPFDGYALRDALVRSHLVPVNKRFLCSYQLAKKLLPAQSSYNLKFLCEQYNIPLLQHHNALDDAKACANLFLALTTEFGIKNEEILTQASSIVAGTYSLDGFRSSYVKGSGSIDFSAIEINEDADQTHPFYERNIVFTGTLGAYKRKEAAQLVAERGGTPQKSVTKTTNYIVMGEFENTMLNGNKSSKLVKAESLISKGADLEIISEDEFLKML